MTEPQACVESTDLGAVPKRASDHVAGRQARSSKPGVPEREASGAGGRVRRGRRNASGRRWQPSWLSAATAMLAVLGLSAVLYPEAASWVSSLNQGQVVSRYEESVSTAEPKAAVQLAQAERYNAALSAGALLNANANVPKGSGTSRDQRFDYDRLLRTPSGVMTRLQIPKIGVDLPVFHGTSEDTLKKGVGHLQGTSLPVGGRSTHTVLTGHRGLAEATLFTDLDKLVTGDTFTLTTFGRVMTYRISETRVVAPEDTASLRQVEGEDLVTLVTCTPLGINTHRILVTGERVAPTPERDVRASERPAEIGFPWWIAVFLCGLGAAAIYLWRSGRPRGRERARSTAIE